MKKSIVVLASLASVALHAGKGRATDIDTLLRGREYKLPELDASLRSGKDPARVATVSSKGQPEGQFTLQFDALADFDAAQKRREDLQRRTGLNIQVVFDAPFYKLRAGNYASKASAEDAAREYAAQEIQAFVVKVK